MKIGILWCALLGGYVFASSYDGFVKDPKGKNQALIVGVPNGLPGIDLDVAMVKKIAMNDAYKFNPTILQNAAGTVAMISKELTRLSSEAGADGTLFFYFSGHGNRGVISVKDRLMKIGEIRSAVEAGRANLGPLSRLVLMFDSCFSGTLLDPVRLLPSLFHGEKLESEMFADQVLDEMEQTRREGFNYWNSLFVFAACRANETSLASSKGSIFTLAMTKAFDETMSKNLTMKEFISKTQSYTKGHYPVARLSPTDLENEKMNP